MKSIVRNPEIAYYYALNVNNGPWSSGEMAIATSWEYAYRYAMNVLHGRFKLGELTIKRNRSYWWNYIRQFNVPENEW